MDLDGNRYVSISVLIEWPLNSSCYSGITHELSQQDLVPDLEAAPPVAVTKDNEDGEDVAGSTVEAHIKLAKTISEYLYILPLNHQQILIYTCSMVSWSWHTGKWHWWTQPSSLLTILPSWSTQIRCLLFSILLSPQQDICLFLCHCHLLCTQQPMWEWWHVLWAHACCYFLETRHTPIWVCFHYYNTNKLELGMCGLSVAQAKLFFTVTMNHVKYSCALVHWYSIIGDFPDECTGMWVVKPNILDDGTPWTAVIHLDSIVWLAHLLPVYGEEQAPRGVKYTDSLDLFSEFYIKVFCVQPLPCHFFTHKCASALKCYISPNFWWILLNLELYTLLYVILMSDR